MRISLIAMLLLLPAVGCTPWQLAKRTMFSELNEFPRNTEGRLACIQYNRWAKKELKELIATGGEDFSSDYASGFLQGFTSYVYGGGSAEPPPLAPGRYWRMGYRNDNGDQAIQQWYEGYAAGARVAKEKGYRQRATVPTSILLGYNLERENPWLQETANNASALTNVEGGAEVLSPTPATTSDGETSTEEMPELTPSDAELKSNGDSGFSIDETDEIESTLPKADNEATPDALDGNGESGTDPMVEPNENETMFDESMDDEHLLEIPGDATDPAPGDQNGFEPEIDQDELDMEFEPDAGVQKSKRKPFQYVFGKTPPKIPWDSSRPNVDGPERLTTPSLEMAKITPNPIDPSGFVPLEASTLKLDAIVPVRAEVESIPEQTSESSEQNPSDQKPENESESAWQSRD